MRTTYIIAFSILTILPGCTTSHIKDSFTNCDKGVEDFSDIGTFTQDGLSFQLTRNWQVQTNKEFNGTECIDSVVSDWKSKIRTFAVFATSEKSKTLPNYFESQIKMMKSDSMEIYDQGERVLDGHKWYYVITRDTIDTSFLKKLSTSSKFPITQAFFYVDDKDRRYTLILGTTSTTDPLDGLCSLVWIIDRVKFEN